MADDIDTEDLENALLVKFFLSDADQAQLMDHWAREEQRIAAQNKMLREAVANAEAGLKTGIKSGLNHVETAYYPSGHHLGGYDLGWGLGWSDDMWDTLYANPVPDEALPFEGVERPTDLVGGTMHDLSEFAVMGGPFAGVAGAAGVPLRFLGVPAFAGSGFTHTPDPNAFRSSDEIEILGLPREEAINRLIVKGHSPEKAESIFERSLTPAYTAADRLPFGLSGKLPTASGEGDSDWELRLKRSAELGAGELLPGVVESGAGMALHPLMRLRRGRSKGQPDQALERLDRTLPDDWNTDRLLHTFDSVEDVHLDEFDVYVDTDTNKLMLELHWSDNSGKQLGARLVRFDGPNREGRQRIFLDGFEILKPRGGIGSQIQAAMFRDLIKMNPPPILRTRAAGLRYKHAENQVGSFVWAKQGFLPTDWKGLRKKLSRNLDELKLPADSRRKVLSILESDDPMAIWSIADYREHIVSIGNERMGLGEYLLKDLDEYEAFMDLTNADQLARFEADTGHQL